ncbi:MAG: dCTP deaminase [Methanothrix sp.]|uniref:dCTP deaminase n=1 Tax=Methanothrix sp. TaxID=90426 RepID=UPI003BAE2B75
MSVLSDARILEKIHDKELRIDPFVFDNVQPSSIDLTLDNRIRTPKSGITLNAFDADIEECFEEKILDEYVLKPGDFIIGQIKETIGLSKRMTGLIQNRNSLIRLGINVGLSSYINPGYFGQLPIVIHNLGSFSVDLIPGMRICQLIIFDVRPDPERDYSQRKDAKYLGESDVGLSKLYMDVEFEEYLKEYNKKSTKEIDKKELIEFLEQRIKEKATDALKGLTDEEKQKIGLL